MLTGEFVFRVRVLDAGRGQWLPFVELGGTFGADSMVPDLVVYRRDHVSWTEEGEPAPRMRQAPDIAVEIRSPGQAAAVNLDKCRRSGEHGTAIALDVDDRTKTVVRLDRTGTAVRCRGADRIDLDAVMPGFERTVDELFRSVKRKQD